MTGKILIPAKTVMENTSNTLDLAQPQRCSRCNDLQARQFESHNVVYEAGMIQFRTFGKKYRLTKKFRLRLPLCETCYKANFIENPDSCEHDENMYGKIAHWRSIGIITGSLFAGAAFILLMRVIPLPVDVVWLQYLWLILIGVALVVYAFTFGLIEIKNQELRNFLTNKQYDIHLHRADVYAKMQLEDPQPGDTAVTVSLQNDAWAEDCAKTYGWVFEKDETN